ncbi:hypothetical protein [Aestuariimicrobium ganziense]|uniref:hypothetical protein n=1 Tax=Aestuariimicrobium ganziense TaxID=2773677 RepID=UPI001940CEEC|nr:hypothetical protein [Aestuariimicrobium ganziense]
MTEATIVTEVLERPARRLVLKRSRSADDYFSYVDEVGCGTSDASAPWDELVRITEAIDEPVGLWLPEAMRPAGTGSYAHGVEVPADWAGDLPEGFDVIDLEPCTFMAFQGEPSDDEAYREAGPRPHRVRHTLVRQAQAISCASLSKVCLSDRSRRDARAHARVRTPMGIPGVRPQISMSS